jgi:hypothetical protein
MCFGSSAAVNAANLYQMGSLLRRVVARLLDDGMTPVFVHHSTKDLPASKPMELADLAFAGIAEFAPQWLLWSRKTAFDPARPGQHELYLSYGGRGGRSGLRVVRIDEGVTAAGATDWAVQVLSLDEAADAGKPVRNKFDKVKVRGDILAKATALERAIAQLTRQPGQWVKRQDAVSAAGLEKASGSV